MRREPSNMGPLSPELAEVLRSGLPGLAEEICTEIRSTIPDYEIPDDTPPTLHTVVDKALNAFVARIVDPTTSSDGLVELLHMLGHKEHVAGRSLDSLHVAIRTAFRMAWHRISEVCARNQISGAVLARVAALQFAFMDEITSPVVVSYLEVGARPVGEVAELRRQLLHQVVERPRVPAATIADLAARVGWEVPAAATPVAVRPNARWLRTVGEADVLLDFDASEPWLLLPGPFDDSRRILLGTALARTRMAVGVTVPLEQIPDSLRWARRVLTLADEGVIEGSRVLLSEEHLIDVWLTSEPALLNQITERQMGGLMRLPLAKRKALTETLRVWLEAWSTAADVGNQLHVHPQTVRYRLHQIKDTIGDRLDDPEARFSLELALRAYRMRERFPQEYLD